MMNEGFEMNMRRGLHRIFVVISVVWALVVAVGWPIYIVNEQRESALRSLKSSYEADMPELAESLRKTSDLQLKQAHLGHFYSTLRAADITTMLFVIALPLGILYGIGGTIAWVRRGFA